MKKNNFTELESYKLKLSGHIPEKVVDNIKKNNRLFEVIGNVMDLYTEKVGKTIININK
jgi:hypothetical protein